MNICMSRIDVRIGWRKYLYECIPSGYVNLWEGTYNAWSSLLDECDQNNPFDITDVFFSPIGEVFRARLRQFPALVNCCTIDWFSDWPPDALQNVAMRFLSDIPDLDASDKVMDGLVRCLQINRTTPLSYLKDLSIKILIWSCPSIGSIWSLTFCAQGPQYIFFVQRIHVCWQVFLAMSEEKEWKPHPSLVCGQANISCTNLNSWKDSSNKKYTEAGFRSFLINYLVILFKMVLGILKCFM